MNDERYEKSHFMTWYAQHSGSYNMFDDSVLRKDAMIAIVKSVKDGDITSLDGVESPLSERIRARHGATDFEMNSNWVGSSQNWICPCCDRSKFQVARVGNKGQILAKLVVHHDHMGEAMKAAFHRAFVVAGTDVEQVDGLRLVQRMGAAFAAYAEVLICEDCNNADAKAKQFAGSPEYFSFSLGQIRRIIICADHQPHRVDAARAVAEWADAEPAYTLRMKLIHAVAKAAATDTHWYEPHARRSEPIPVFGRTQGSVEPEIYRWASADPLLKALGSDTEVTTPNLSQWRQVPAKAASLPPVNYLAMLYTEEAYGRLWESLPEDWRCPICQRRKHEIVYVGKQGKITFSMKEVNGRGAWASVTRICNHCESTLMSVKREGKQRADHAPANSYSFVEPHELGKIITARPHSPHLIRAREAQELMELVVKRILAQRNNVSSI